MLKNCVVCCKIFARLICGQHFELINEIWASLVTWWGVTGFYTIILTQNKLVFISFGFCLFCFFIYPIFFRSNSPSPFPDVQESFPAPVTDPVSIQPKGLLPPEMMHTYDSVTGKLIRRSSQVPRHFQKPAAALPGHEVHLNFRYFCSL